MKRYPGAFAFGVSALMLGAPAHSAAIIGAPIVVASDGDVIATFVGANALFESRLGLVGGPSNIFDNKTNVAGDTFNLGSFSAGTALTFSLFVVNTGTTYFTGAASGNPDGLAHAAVDTAGAGTIASFEDTLGGGDLDYNDLTFSFTNTGPALPEPASWAMFMGGFALVGSVVRRRRVTTHFA